jgi:hypothetical protein
VSIDGGRATQRLAGELLVAPLLRFAERSRDEHDHDDDEPCRAAHGVTGV